MRTMHRRGPGVRAGLPPCLWRCRVPISLALGSPPKFRAPHACRALVFERYLVLPQTILACTAQRCTHAALVDICQMWPGDSSSQHWCCCARACGHSGCYCRLRSCLVLTTSLSQHFQVACFQLSYLKVQFLPWCRRKLRWGSMVIWCPAPHRRAWGWAWGW